MRDFKKYTSVQIRKQVEAVETSLLDKLRIDQKDRVFQIWKDRFDDVWLKSREVLETKLAYIHSNPLQQHWNLVKSPFCAVRSFLCAVRSFDLTLTWPT